MRIILSLILLNIYHASHADQDFYDWIKRDLHKNDSHKPENIVIQLGEDRSFEGTINRLAADTYQPAPEDDQLNDAFTDLNDLKLDLKIPNPFASNLFSNCKLDLDSYFNCPKSDIFKTK